MGLKCTVEREGSWAHCYAVLAMPMLWLSRGVVVPMIHSEHVPMLTRPGSGKPSNPRLRSMTSDT